MLKELENLLAEITRQQAAGAPSKPPPPAAAAAAPPTARLTPRRQPLDAEVVMAEPVRQSVRQHVAKTVDTTDITQNLSRLGADVGLADDRMEARLQGRFDHQLSHIQDRTGSEPALDHGGTATPLAKPWFQDHEAVRQAIIMSEILNRPVDRW